MGKTLRSEDPIGRSIVTRYSLWNGCLAKLRCAKLLLEIIPPRRFAQAQAQAGFVKLAFQSPYELPVLLLFRVVQAGGRSE